MPYAPGYNPSPDHGPGPSPGLSSGSGMGTSSPSLGPGASGPLQDSKGKREPGSPAVARVAPHRVSIGECHRLWSCMVIQIRLFIWLIYIYLTNIWVLGYICVTNIWV